MATSVIQIPSTSIAPVTQPERQIPNAQDLEMVGSMATATELAADSTAANAMKSTAAAVQVSFQMHAYLLALLANAMQLSISEHERSQGSDDKAKYHVWLNKAVTNTESQGNWVALGAVASVVVFIGRFFSRNAGTQKVIENISSGLPSIFGIAAQKANAEVTKANGNNTLLSNKMQSGSQEAANFRSAVTDQAMQGAREAMRMTADAAKNAAGG